MISVPSLLYHDVVPLENHTASGFEGPVAKRYKLNPEQFVSHLDAIQQRLGTAATTILPEQVIAGESTAGRFLLTFDDGGASSLRIAELLEQRGFRGLFFITTDRIGTPGFVTPEEIRELAQRGHAIGSHSCSHPPEFSKLTDAELQLEWGESCGILSSITGTTIDCGSVPGGYFSERVAHSAQHVGMKILFNSEPTSEWHHIDSLWIAGRYSIVQSTTAATAALLASNDAATLRKLRLTWGAKKWAKRLLGPGYRLISRLFWQRSGQ